MKLTVLSLPTFAELSQHVHQTLCEHERLDPRQAPIQKSLVKRRGKSCGYFFQIDGPRMVKIYAVWAGDEHRILFYDSGGVRFAETRLTESPDARKLAA
jgi:hypothetical protein